MIAQSILDTIGATPLFEFTSEQYPMPEGTKIYAKLEYLNPGGSVKDRLGVHLLKEAMKTGKINQATTIIEPTAGNTGLTCISCQSTGLKTIFVVPEKFSQEKQQLMQALGAKIVPSPTEQGIVGAITSAQDLAKEIPNSYVPLQFENPDNPAAYYEGLWT